ncbi:MAG: DUF6677 family protein [Pyrinomonadaceae bacterium]
MNVVSVPQKSHEINHMRAWGIGLVAWLVPGGGHLLQGRWQRGLLVSAAVGLMFFLGLILGGHLFSFGGEGTKQGVGGLLQIPPAIANVGTGILYIVCLLTKTGMVEQAERATFEYGNTFLWVAGLLNYLSMLDAFDLAVGRKL